MEKDKHKQQDDSADIFVSEHLKIVDNETEEVLLNKRD